MIYTQYGSPVEIISYDAAADNFRIRRISDGRVMEKMERYHLKADDGAKEIDAAITALTPPLNLPEI